MKYSLMDGYYKEFVVVLVHHMFGLDTIMDNRYNRNRHINTTNAFPYYILNISIDMPLYLMEKKGIQIHEVNVSSPKEIHIYPMGSNFHKLG